MGLSGETKAILLIKWVSGGVRRKETPDLYGHFHPKAPAKATLPLTHPSWSIGACWPGYPQGGAVPNVVLPMPRLLKASEYRPGPEQIRK
jgi:hypothetical protein